MAPISLVGQGLLVIEASRSHSDTLHSTGLLWASDQSDAETCTWQHADRIAAVSEIVNVSNFNA
jgi:hypothetical protein